MRRLISMPGRPRRTATLHRQGAGSPGPSSRGRQRIAAAGCRGTRRTAAQYRSPSSSPSVPPTICTPADAPMRVHRRQSCPRVLERSDAARCLHAHVGPDGLAHQRDVVDGCAPAAESRWTSSRSRPWPAWPGEAITFSSSVSRAVSRMTLQIAPPSWAASTTCSMSLRTTSCHARLERADVDHHVDLAGPVAKRPRPPSP